MTERERLIEILKTPIHPHLDVDPIEALADYLLDGGVFVPPCQVGETVYIILDGEITEDVVLFIHYDDNFFFTTSRADGLMFGKSMFLAREEAEQALQKYQQNK